MLHLALFLIVQGGPDSLSLGEALRLARSQRPEVHAIAARVEEASAQRRLSSRPLNPSAEYSVNDATNAQRIAVRQSLASFVPLLSERAAAGAALSAARADAVQAAAELERAVRRSWYGALAAQRRLSLLESLSGLADSMATAARRRAAAGDIAELEQRQFALEAVSARLAHSRARAEFAARQAALFREIGRSGAERPIGGSLQPTGEPFEPSALDTSAIASIPRVERARFLALGAERHASAARWARLPLASIFAEHDWSREAAFTASTRVGVGISVPLFSFGNEAVAIATARARQAEAGAREVELEARRDVSAAQARVREAGLRARLATDSLAPEAVRLREGAARLYEAGRVSVLQVIEALRAEREAQLQVLDELLAYQEARADLDALLGRVSSSSTSP